jgi:putative transposase
MDKQAVRKTFKYKLRPTPQQERALAFVVRRCRELYNAALQERKEAWEKRGVGVTLAQPSAQLPEIKEVRPDYRDIHSQVLQDVLTRLDRAFQAFFRRVKDGERPGYPRFRGESRYHSFTYKQFGNGATLDDGFLVLSKIGRIAVRWSRPIQGTPKTVTINHEADGWYACFSCAEVPLRPLGLTGQETGIDLGLESFATLADGTLIHNPRCYRKAEAYLRRCQRRVARRKQGTNRRRKAVNLLAKAHQQVRRQRRDFHHKAALSLVRHYDAIYYEDLRVRNMVKNHSLARSISDAGWSAFLTLLSHKAACAGRKVLAVEPALTSQICSGPSCGLVVWKGLSVRWHECPDCGSRLHRDHNAARNILAQGKKGRGAGQAPQASTWAGGPSVA